MAPFQFLLKESLRFRRLLPWLFLSLLALIVAIAWRVLAKGTGAETTATDRYINVVNLLVFRFLPLASAIYSTMIVSQEIEQKTIVYLLTRPIERWKLIVGRYGATVVAVVIVSLISLIATILGAGGFGQVHISYAHDLLAILLGAMAYGSLFMFITLVINRGLIFCVLFAFGWESSVPNLATGMQKLSILSHMQAIADHPETEGGKKFLQALSGLLGHNNMSPSASAFALLVFSIVMIGLSAYWFTTNEYIPREDAE